MIHYTFSLNKTWKDKFYFHDYCSYTDNLRVVDTIENYGGCVNTIEWDKTGTKLLSGGDDLCIRIHQYFSNKENSFQESCLYERSLGNSRNILSTKFMKFFNEKIISGSKCGSVFLFDINDDNQKTLTPYHKHEGPVLNIVSSPHRYYEFVSVSTDKTLSIYDIRTDQAVIKLNFPCGLAAADYHPLDNWKLAIGGGDSFVRVFDWRLLSNTSESEIDKTFSKVVELCRPLEFPLDTKVSFGSFSGSGKRYVNSVTYEAPTGHNILVSYMYDSIYLFNTGLVEDEESGTQFNDEIITPNNPQPANNPPPTNNPFHIHYNWENTGPPREEASTSSNVIVCPPPIQNILSNLQKTHENYNRGNNYLSTENTIRQLRSAKRYKQIGVYHGIQNFRTMIKDSVFWGSKYILSGSECGHILVWDRSDSQPITAIPTDSHVTNRVCPHPVIPMIASCGLDRNVKIIASDMSPVHKDLTEKVSKIYKIVQMNQMRTERAKTSQSISMMDLLRIMRAQRLIQQRNSNIAGTFGNTDEDDEDASGQDESGPSPNTDDSDRNTS